MFTVYLTLAGSQLFMQPVVGLADNGDFPKVLAPFDVCTPNPELWNLKYVRSKYEINPACYWDSRLASSETLFVRLITVVASLSGRHAFHITAAGKAHLSIVLASLAILLWVLHDCSPLVRFVLPPFVILVFSDVLYVSYLNSFYMDAASMVFLLLTAVLGAAGILRPRLWVAIAFGVAGVLLALSKTQHLVTSLLLGSLAVWLAVRGYRTGRRLAAACWIASGAAILTAGIVAVSISPEDYKAEPFYSVIFYNLVPASDDQATALIELGLPAADLPLVGTHAYSEESPITTPEWREDFIHRVSYCTLLAFYLNHPSVALRLISRGLSYFAPSMRPGNMANYQREDGFPPGSLAQHFALWSHLRAWLMWVFPAHLVAFYALMGIGASRCLWMPQLGGRWPLWPLVLPLVAAGVLEFLFAVLLDATETARHLFFFHVITEILVVCSLAAVLTVFCRPRSEDAR